MEPDGSLGLGPFRGRATEHTKIAVGQGICGRAIAENATVVVDDVTKDPNYLACSLGTRSEIVVPIRVGSASVAEIDVDSDGLAAFDSRDRDLLEEVARALGDFLARTQLPGCGTTAERAAAPAAQHAVLEAESVRDGELAPVSGAASGRKQNATGVGDFLGRVRAPRGHLAQEWLHGRAARARRGDDSGGDRQNHDSARRHFARERARHHQQSLLRRRVGGDRALGGSRARHSKEYDPWVSRPRERRQRRAGKGPGRHHVGLELAAEIGRRGARRRSQE